MKNILAVLASSSLVFLSACNSDNGKALVSGVIANADGQSVYLEQLGLTSSLIVDSATVEPDGSFRLVGAIQSEPTFYNVRLANGKFFTVLADSAEAVSVNADASLPILAQNLQFQGSPRNENLAKVTLGASRLLDGIKRNGPADSLLNEIKAYKSMVRDLIFADPQSMVGYFAVLQTVGGSRIFDVMNKQDQQIFATAATSLNVAYPRSEQVQYLCNLVLQARAVQRRNARRDSLINSAEVVESPELRMPDANGDIVSLSALHGHYVILSFWHSQDQQSRAANRQLAKVYKKYADRGLKIYSVSFDTSRVLWEAASSNDHIDWINVCDLYGNQSQAAILYNVSSVPANYIIDPDGRLVGKDLFGTRLDEKLQQIFK